MHMQERLVTTCIDMYEPGPKSASTAVGHGVRIIALTPFIQMAWFAHPLCFQRSHPTVESIRVNK